MKQNLSYYMNALYYSVWRCWSDLFIFTTRFARRKPPSESDDNNTRAFLERQNRYADDTISDVRDYKDGVFISWFFERFFIGVWGFYILAITFLVFVLIINFTDSFAFSMTCSLLSGGICYYPLQGFVFSKNRYISYFNKFEKKSETWHRKWKIIAILFVFGSLFVFLSGVVGGILITEFFHGRF